MWRWMWKQRLFRPKIPMNKSNNMPKELTNSTIERQNVLNNPFAVTEIQKAV
jgi:hypothetical protein